MLKNITKLECAVNEKIYQFLCDQDSPIEHVKEALFQFGKYIGQIEDNIRQSQAALQPKVDNPQITPIDSLAKENEPAIDVNKEEAN